VNLESNRNNSLRSPNSEFNIIRANNKYNRGNNNNQLNPSINDYGLFPFMNDGINYDLGKFIKSINLIFVHFLNFLKNRKYKNYIFVFNY